MSVVRRTSRTVLMKAQNKSSSVTQWISSHTANTAPVMNCANAAPLFQAVVRSIWLRHKLENFKGRLSALEAKVANEGIELSNAQIAALNIVAKWSSMTISSIWLSMTLTTPKPKRCLRRLTAFPNASTRPFCKNFPIDFPQETLCGYGNFAQWETDLGWKNLN